jgi:type VI secretion system protein ImpM
MGASVFGKIPSHGDFVAQGTGSETGRAFERWLQMANERMFESKTTLPEAPLGFSYRAPKASSVLLGVMARSRDKVGRVFPLALFWELDDPTAIEHVAVLPAALPDVYEALSETVVAGETLSKAELLAAVSEATFPRPDELRRRVSVQQQRLDSCSLGTLFERIFGDEPGVHYAMSVLVGACKSAEGNPVAQPVVLGARATSDLELSFWLACAAACLPDHARPASAIWDVATSTVLIAMGSPDSNLLNYLMGPRVQYRKFWGTLNPAPDANDRAKMRLPQAVLEAIDDAHNMKVGDFLSTLASASQVTGSDKKGS